MRPEFFSEIFCGLYKYTVFGWFKQVYLKFRMVLNYVQTYFLDLKTVCVRVVIIIFIK